jgi:hypothetical protein
MKKFILPAFFAISFSAQSQFGFIKDVVSAGANFVKDVAATAGTAYQTVTAPVRNVTTTIYNNTLQQPINELQNSVNSILPKEVKDFYAYEIKNRIEPFYKNTTSIATGEVNVVTGATNIVNHSIALVKEVFITPEIAALYNAARGASSPVPQEFFQKIQPHWASVTNRPLHSSYAKYIVSESLVNTLTFLGNSQMDAITLYDVIIFRSSLSMTPRSLSLLAHEMTHVAQYRQLGFTAFLTTYIAENLKNGYENADKEIEGAEVGRRMYSLLNGNPAATNSQVRFSNISPTNFSNTAAANIAYLDAASANPNEYVGYLITKAQASNNINETKAIVGYILNNSRVSGSNKAYCCRMMSSGPLSTTLSLQDREVWAKAAASYAPKESINWLFLASAASQMQDDQTNFDALINLAGIMISEELAKLSPNYTRMRAAARYLGSAVQLGTNANFQQTNFYDTRLPLVMLVELGVYLPLTYSEDMQLNYYAQTVADLDKSINSKDLIHLRVIGALTGAHLYFTIKNDNLYTSTGDPNYLNEKKMRVRGTIAHAQWGLRELAQFYPVQGVELYRNMYDNYLQRANTYNY